MKKGYFITEDEWKDLQGRIAEELYEIFQKTCTEKEKIKEYPKTSVRADVWVAFDMALKKMKENKNMERF